MNKVLRLVHSDGTVYHVDLHLIAENRARYYEKNDPDTTFEEEYNLVMTDGTEGANWFLNNMNPEDILEEEYVIVCEQVEDFYKKIKECSVEVYKY